MKPQTNSPEDDQHIADLLETAKRRGAIRPAFQPVVGMKDGTIASFEVLARWTDGFRAGFLPRGSSRWARAVAISSPLPTT